jgi:hypothetical protein
MAVGMLFDAPEGSQAIYDALTEKMFGTLQPSTTPEGLIIHTAGPLLDGGWRVFDVWESEEHFWRFFDAQVLPAAQDLGQAPPSTRPEFFSIHNVIGRHA